MHKYCIRRTGPSALRISYLYIASLWYERTIYYFFPRGNKIYKTRVHAGVLIPYPNKLPYDNIVRIIDTIRNENSDKHLKTARKLPSHDIIYASDSPEIYSHRLLIARARVCVYRIQRHARAYCITATSLRTRECYEIRFSRSRRR